MRTEQPTFRIPPLDARPRFPEVLTVSVPRGTKHAIQEQADAVGMSASEYLRHQLATHVDVIDPSDTRMPVSPSEKMRRFLAVNPDVAGLVSEAGLSAPDMGWRITAEHLAEPPGGILQGDTQTLTMPGCPGEMAAVAPKDVGRVWSYMNLDGAVLRVNRKMPGAPFDPATLRRACEVAKHQLWLVVEDQAHAGMAVTSILKEEDGRGKTLVWQLVVGRGFSHWRWTRDHIEQWAREQGCARARAYGRPGWQRVGLDDYDAKGVIFERSL